MKRPLAFGLAITLSIALAAPAAAADPWRPFKGGGTTADTITAPEGRPAGAGWRYSGEISY